MSLRNPLAVNLSLVVALLAFLLCPVDLPGRAAHRSPDTSDSVISNLAYHVLNDRVAANQASFYIYQGSDSGFNHGFPSGFLGSHSKIHLDTGCVDDPVSPSGCSNDANYLDRTRGTVMRITFDPLTGTEFAGINFEEPENWGVNRTGTGYDLRPTTSLVFDVRSPQGISVQFGIGDCTSPFTTITASPTFQTLTIPLNTLVNCRSGPLNLANVHLLFTVVTNVYHAPQGGTILLDNIHFEPVPAAQLTRLSLPLGTQTFGIVPRSLPGGGRVPYPPDQVNRNVTTIYESSLTLLALLYRGEAGDLQNARRIADALTYALEHDNHGDPLPPTPGGFHGLHNSMMGGDLAFLNGQESGEAQAGDIRLAGFSCGISPTGFCLVLDGATGGNNAFAILALAGSYRRFHDQTYLDAALNIGNWIEANLHDQSSLGYGGYFLGYSDEGITPKTLLTGKSVENNADIASAFYALAMLERLNGHPVQAQIWTERANAAGDFVMAMFDDEAGRFYAGTVPIGMPAGAGICPDGLTRGDDVINTCDFLDSNTFTTLALAGLPRYRYAIDWRRPIQYALQNFDVSVSAAGQTYHGFNIVDPPTAGPQGVAWEFTGQMVVALQFVDALYQETGFEDEAAEYLAQIRQAQQFAPFTDGLGMVASTLQDGDLLPPSEHCLSTPFQCIPSRVGLAATTWAVLADRNVNPFNPSVNSIYLPLITR